jgi:hypothetical protein
MKLFASFLLPVFTVCSFNFSLAQIASVKVINTSDKATTFSFADLEAMPQTILNVEAEDGTPHNYSGVEIQFLLSKADVAFGKDVHRQTLDSYVYIKAADNYSVIYALTEIDTAFSSKKMILALMKDGKALPQNFGPLQIIATGEKKHARLIRQVTEIDIRKVE